MEQSPFNAAYATLFEKGISVIPIHPKDKCPGKYQGGVWKAMPGWNEYATRQANDTELDAWETWPDAGIGMCPGRISGVIALDFDYDGDGAMAAVEAITPPSHVRKVGQKGYTAFYMYTGQATQRFSIKRMVDGVLRSERVLDLLSCGAQTVLPPSIHPGTGQPYQWATPDTLENIDLDELPVLPADYAEQVAKALEPFAGSSHTSSGQPLGDTVPDYEITEVEFKELISALDAIPYQDYEQFTQVGMALRTIGGMGFDMWHEWAKRSHHYNPAESPDWMRRKWATFRNAEGGITHGSIFKWAREQGWQPPELPDYAAQLMEGLKRREAEARKSGLWLMSKADLGAIREPDWLIRQRIVSDSLAMLYGASGLGKSFVAFDMGLSIAAGIPWQGNDVQQGGVICVVGEGKAGILSRMVAWERLHEIDTANIPFYLTNQPVPFLDANAVHELCDVIAAAPELPRLIIIDTLNRNFGDGDENNTKDMSRFIDALVRLRVVTGACVMVVHHTGKMDATQARGNSSLRAALDTEMMLAHKGETGGIKLECTKQKDAEHFVPNSFELEVVTIGHDEETGNAITSCVVVPDSDQQAQEFGAEFVTEKAKQLASESNRGLGEQQRIAVDLVKRIVHRMRAANPTAEVLSMRKAEFREDLQAAGCPKGKLGERCTWLLQQGFLTEVSAMSVTFAE